MTEITAGRKCTICVHDARESIDLACITSGNIAAVSRDFAVSEDALRRHASGHLGSQLRRALATVELAPLASTARRIHEIGLRAGEASERAYEAGNTQLGARLGDAALRAELALAARLGIDSAAPVLQEIESAVELLRAIYRASHDDPALMGVVIDHLREAGQTESADDLASLFQETKEIAQ